MNSATASQVEVASGPLLELNPTVFQENFNRKPFLIGHQLCQHPLFDLERLMKLARDLPERQIEYNAGKLNVNQDPSLTPRNGLSVADTLRRIRDCQSWMVLKHVEHDPEYQELLNNCLKEVGVYSEKIVPGMRKAHGYIFVTSPGSVTPYHMDPEHNFLLQIRGNKIVHLFDGNDPGIVSQQDFEKFYGGLVRNMTLTDENRDKAWVFDLQPGYGLHFPVTYPHFVQNGNDVSISFSITFRTPDLDRHRGLHTANWNLRRWGFKPWAVGRSRMLDTLKYATYRWSRRIMGLFSRD